MRRKRGKLGSGDGSAGRALPLILSLRAAKSPCGICTPGSLRGKRRWEAAFCAAVVGYEPRLFPGKEEGGLLCRKGYVPPSLCSCTKRWGYIFHGTQGKACETSKGRLSFTQGACRRGKTLTARGSFRPDSHCWSLSVPVSLRKNKEMGVHISCSACDGVFCGLRRTAYLRLYGGAKAAPRRG